MKTFRFPMANDIVDRSCKIRIDGDLPDFDLAPFDKVNYYYETKGRELFSILTDSLPRQIIDALFVELCRDKAKCKNEIRLEPPKFFLKIDHSGKSS